MCLFRHRIDANVAILQIKGNFMTCVGLDIGHSAVKLSWRGKDGKVKFLSFPSAVIPAMTISDRTAAEEAKAETVTVDGQEFFVGDTAIHESGNRLRVTGLHHRWMDMPEFQALVQVAMNKVKEDVGKISTVTTGLPSSVFREKQTQMRNIVGSCTDAEVRVYTEPNGVSMRYLIGEDGEIREDTHRNLGVIAIGRYTTDFMAMLNGRWVESASGSTVGMSRAANLLLARLKEQGFGEIDYLDADDALWRGNVRYYGKESDVTPMARGAMQILNSEIFDAVTSQIGDIGSRLEVMLVAGGGAPLLFEHLKQYFPQAILLEEPRMAVAEGFRRQGEAILKIRGV